MLRSPSAFLLTILLLLPITTGAVVEIGVNGQPPVTLGEVYLREGTAFLALDDVLPLLGLAGRWDSVRHRYSIQTPQGTVTFFPGGRYLNLGGRFIPLSHPARFIDGRLRVPEEVVTGPLAGLSGSRISSYRNLDQTVVPARDDETPLDRLFAFLLQKKRPEVRTRLSGVAIDPGHGGQDPGSIGGGVKEKDLTLTLARDLERQLKMQLDIPVFLSRDGDYTVPQEERWRSANHPEIDALVLLHVQAAQTASPAGVNLFVRPAEEGENQSLPAEQGESLRLARALADALDQAGIPVAGIAKVPLLPLGRGNLPTVLIELGFLSNPEDQARLTDPTGRQVLTRALFEGLRNFGSTPMEVSQ
jgi:N-acetylmuramoyl-L-alanine amidase